MRNDRKRRKEKEKGKQNEYLNCTGEARTRKSIETTSPDKPLQGIWRPRCPVRAETVGKKEGGGEGACETQTSSTPCQGVGRGTCGGRAAVGFDLRLLGPNSLI